VRSNHPANPDARASTVPQWILWARAGYRERVCRKARDSAGKNLA